MGQGRRGVTSAGRRGGRGTRGGVGTPSLTTRALGEAMEADRSVGKMRRIPRSPANKRELTRLSSTTRFLSDCLHSAAQPAHSALTNTKRITFTPLVAQTAGSDHDALVCAASSPATGQPPSSCGPARPSTISLHDFPDSKSSRSAASSPSVQSPVTRRSPSLCPVHRFSPARVERTGAVCRTWCCLPAVPR
jgi:hypothetical protein